MPVSKEVLDAGTVAVLAVVVIGPLITVIGLLARWLYTSNRRQADATDKLTDVLTNMKTAMQAFTDAQSNVTGHLTSMESRFAELVHKIDQLPEQVKGGVMESMDAFLDKLARALRESGSVPEDFSVRSNGRRRGLFGGLFG